MEKRKVNSCNLEEVSGVSVFQVDGTF